MELLRHNVERLVRIDASPLRGAIAVGMSVAANSVTVELLAIEVREAGCRALLRFRSARERMGGRRVEPMGPPDATVDDDLGTRYEAGVASLSQSDTGGEAAFHFTPPPPQQARRLAILIERFGDGGLPQGAGLTSRDVRGPWGFEVQINEASVSPG